MLQSFHLEATQFFKTVLHSDCHQASTTLFWINYCVHNVNFYSAGDWDCHPLDPAVWHVSISIVFQSYIAVMYQWQWIIAETAVYLITAFL